MRISRIKNTIRNSIWGFINQGIMLIFPFIIRTYIINTLGTKYIGLNGLFTSILSVLSLAELGFGNAVVYSTYKPIANNDNEKICALMKLYKDVYEKIGWSVLVLGLALIPCIPYFIKDSIPDNINIYMLYAIYLFNAVVSYWMFAYKNCLLTAFQRNDIATKITLIVRTFFYFLQIIILCLFANYYIYLMCMPASNIAINLITARIVDTIYPEFRSYGEVSKEEKNGIRKQVIGLLAQRLAHLSRNSLDNIIISAFLGLTYVAIYGNYFYIINSVTTILAIFFTSMQAGIGNSIVKETIEKNYNDLQKINFLYMWIAGWCTTCIAILTQPFMEVWVGKHLLFPIGIVFILAFYFYTMKMTDPVGAYIGATGLWWKCKYTYLLETMVNLLLNIILGYLWGVIGIIIATMISVLFVNYVSTVYVLFKNYFKNIKMSKYFYTNIFYFIVTIVVVVLSYYIINYIYIRIFNNINSLLEFGIKLFACLIIPNILYFGIYSHTNIYKVTKRWIINKKIRGTLYAKD